MACDAVVQQFKHAASVLPSSRSPVGSSASSTRGPVTSAGGIATRCCVPSGKLPCAWSLAPQAPLPQAISALYPEPWNRLPRSSNGIATFSAAVKSGNNCAAAQKSDACDSENPRAQLSFLVSMRFRFEVYSTARWRVCAARRCKSVLLPAPDGATIATSLRA